MRCVCCGKTFTEKNAKEEIRCGWHRSCVRRFFGTDALPKIRLTEENLRELALDSVQKGFTVPGVQKKLSLHLEKEGSPRLTLIGYPAGYILKPQTEEYRCVPEAEHVVMTMAQLSGIRTVPFGLIKISSDTEGNAYISKRVDRNREEKLAMEDFCQLDGRLTQDKYHGSYERCAKILRKYSERPGLDLSELFLRLVFCFVTGNSDMHLKNFSLIETASGSGQYVLSPAYDLLPTNIIIPQDPEEFALPMNGKKRNLHRKDFLLFAQSCGLTEKAALSILQTVCRKKELYLQLTDESLLPADMKQALKDLIEERTGRLSF